ncbi:MAG: hypothetical protein WC750_00625 [Patescibacteria group bacterium]|jgi:hypothetical protein
MNSELPPSAESALKQQELQMFKAAVAQMLSSAEPGKDKTKILIEAIKKHDADYGLTNDQQALESLVKDIAAYDRSESLEEFAAKKIQSLRESEGRYSDPQAFFSRLAITHMQRLGWQTFENNPVFGYEMIGNDAVIHLFNPFKGTELDGPGSQVFVLRKFANGLNEFVKVVESDPSIQNVTASSPLLTDPKFQEFMKKYGFEIKGSLDEERKQKYFSQEQREIVEAIATRDQLLKK